MKRSEKIGYAAAVILAMALCALLWFAGDANATVYNRYEDVVRNTSGRTVSGASVYVYIADTDSLAALYANAAGTASKQNPTSSDTAGRFWFYAGAGKYDIAISRSGIERYTLEDVSLGLVVDGDVTFGASVTVNDSLRVVKGVKGQLTVMGNIVASSSIVAVGSIFSNSTVTSTGDLTVSSGKINQGNSVQISQGTADPEGSVSANVGSLYQRRSGSGATALYLKGSGLFSTGWVPLYLDKSANQTFTANVTVEDTLKTPIIKGLTGLGTSLAVTNDLSVGGNLSVMGDLDVTGNDIKLYGLVMLTSGEGSPEGVVTATKGTLYINRLGGTGTTLYVKETGTGSTNTGWVAK